jgi:hypothetical protein
MLKNKRTRPTRTALLAVLLAGGLLLTQSAQAAVQDSEAAQKTAAPRRDASAAQPKVSPYARMNRQRSQADAAAAKGAPHPTALHATRKGAKGGARKN